MKKQAISPIKQMFFGRKGQSDTIRMSKEYFECLRKYIKIEEEFEEKFLSSEAALYLYGKVMEASNLANCEENFCYYKEGFAFGVSLGLEIAELINGELP